MLDMGKKSRQYFVPPNSFSPNWRLKSEEEYSLETGTRPKESRKYKFKRLQDLMLFNASNSLNDQDKFIEELDRFQFVDLLRNMLCLDPDMRCKPAWCKQHQFVTMNHLQNYLKFKRVIQGIEVMQRACRREKPVNRMILAQQQQQFKYLQALNQQATNQQREQLHQQLKAHQQHELNWGLHNAAAPSTSLQYFISDNLQTLSDRQPGIYPTPDWSPASAEWQQPEYGTKAHPIVIPDSPNTRPVTSEHLLQEHLYKAQLLRNALAKTTATQHSAPSLDLSSHFINPAMNPVTLPNTALTLSGLTNVLTNRYLS